MSAPRVALIHAMPIAIEPVAGDALMLGQFSMARAAAGIPPLSGRKVLTSPHCAVARLKQLFADR